MSGRRTLLVERVPVSWQMARLLRSDYVQTRVRRPQIAVQVNSDPLLQGSGSTFLLFFLDNSDPAKCTQVRGWQPSAGQTQPRFRGATWPSTTDHPLCPRFSPRPAASTASSIRVLYILLHLHPRRHPDCDSDCLIRSLLQTFSRTLVTPTTAITPSGSVAANSSSTFAPFARQQWLDVSGLPSVSW